MNHFRLRATLGALIAGNVLACMFAPTAMASSHREAPFITRHPKIDATDFYMFRSYQQGRADYTTLIANYVPLQDAYGGPNFFTMDPDALYEIHIDNNGDAREDITFQFRFKNTNKDAQFTVGGKKVSIPLVINGAAIADVDAAGFNVRETYSVNVVRGDRRAGTRQAVTGAGGQTTFDKPIDNIGNKAIPNYQAYAAKHVHTVNLPGCATPARMFVGQRKDPLVVNLGETFDLINIKAPAVEFSATAEKDARNWPPATLLQSTHHFPEALRDLDAVLAAEPDNPQAWLTRATVLTVRGEYEDATRSCAHLSSLSSQLVSISCIAGVGAMTGRAAASAALLELALRRDPEADAALQVWVLTLLAEIAERRGDAAAAAEAHYRRALARSPRDSYLTGAYADFLLDRKRPADVLKLVKDQTRIDGLLLRHALALRQMPAQDDALRAADAELRARFNAAMQRGDTVHQREQTRYELHVRGDARAVLALAQKNGAVQKEPADMRILLEAALMADAKAAAAPVLEWVAHHALEDVAIRRLARQLMGGV